MALPKASFWAVPPLGSLGFLGRFGILGLCGIRGRIFLHCSVPLSILGWEGLLLGEGREWRNVRVGCQPEPGILLIRLGGGFGEENVFYETKPNQYH
jgi:hypothetical protein